MKNLLVRAVELTRGWEDENQHFNSVKSNPVSDSLTPLGHI